MDMYGRTTGRNGSDHIQQQSEWIQPGPETGLEGNAFNNFEIFYI